MYYRKGQSLPAVFVLAALAGAAHGQAFTNPGFETGTLAGWTVAPTFNGLTLVETVQPVDIDGPGPLGISNAGKFSVGNSATMNNHQAGIELYQMLNLAAGVEYSVSLNWASLRTSGIVHEHGGVFSVIVGDQVLATMVAGPTGPELPNYGRLQGNVIVTTGGPQKVGVRITRPGTIGAGLASTLHQWVDNFQIVTPVQGACCMNDGTCRLLSEFLCNLEDGVYRGNSVSCTSANCPPPGGCCRFLDCQILSQRQCERSWGVYYGHGTTCATCQAQGTLLPIPGANGVSSSDLLARGMWFTAPRRFTITGLRVPDPSQQGLQNVEIMRLPDVPPDPAYTSMNNFISLGRFIGEPSGRIIPVSIPVEAGEVIGVLGNCGAAEMMHHSSGNGNFQSAVLGEPLTLYRLTMAGNLNVLPAQNLSSGISPGTVLARVEIYYIDAGPAGCYANCDESTVEPVLNVDDFTCFINSYAAALSLPHEQQVEHRGNCDRSTIAPVLNVDDFTCFINEYAQGCP